MLKFDPRLTKNEARNEARKAKRLALKLYCIAKKGYHCEVCGELHNAYSMSFHHTDSSKDNEISNMIHAMRDKKIIEADFKNLHEELEKTVLVCEVCHQRIHEFDQYTADTYHNSIRYMEKFKEFELTKDFKFDNNKFVEMYRGDDYEQSSESGNETTAKKFLRKKGKIVKP